MNFNEYDEKFKVNRRSCQQYEVLNGVPQCPLGRTGIYGRGNLYFYGPNYCILAIFKRFAKYSLRKTKFFLFNLTVIFLFLIQELQ